MIGQDERQRDATTEAQRGLFCPTDVHNALDRDTIALVLRTL